MKTKKNFSPIVSHYKSFFADTFLKFISKNRNIENSFYLNKSKIENLSKGKIRFMLLRLRLEIKLKDQLPEETYNLIMEEIDEIDRMMDTKLDGALEEAIQQEIDLQNY